MKKINYRPILFIFIFLCLGLVTAKLFLSKNLLEIVFLLILIFLLLVHLIFNKLFKHLVLICLSFLFGISLFFLEFNIYTNKNLNNCIVVGTIDKTDNYVQNVNLTLKNVKVNNKNKLYKIEVNVSGSDIAFTDYNKGDIIQFSCDLKSINILKNQNIDTSNYKKSIKYLAEIKADEVIKIGFKLNFFDKLKLKIEDTINNNFSFNNASLANAILYGNTDNLSTSIKDDYRISGISHLLAISGLHIGLLVAILLFILKKLNRVIKTIIISVILILYSALCGFSFSVIRASIMAIIVMIAGCFGQKDDILTSVSIAGIILILFKPLSFFDLSFLLSFGSVFGIILLNKPIKALLLKLKLPNNKALDAVSISVSAQLFILPIVAKFFNSVSIVGIIINIFAIPIFAVGYYFLFCNLLLTLIIPVFSKLFIVPDFIFTIVNTISEFLANYSFASVKIFGIGFIGIICFYGLIILFSKYVNLSKKPKLFTAIILILFIIPSVVLSNVSFIKNNTITSIGDNNLIKKENYLILEISDNINKSNVNNLIEELNFLKIRKINDIIVKSDYTNKNYLFKILDEYKIKNIYIKAKDYEEFNYLQNYNNYNLILYENNENLY